MRSLLFTATVATLLGVPGLALADDLAASGAPETLGWLGAESRPDDAPQ